MTGTKRDQLAPMAQALPNTQAYRHNPLRPKNSARMPTPTMSYIQMYLWCGVMLAPAKKDAIFAGIKGCHL